MLHFQNAIENKDSELINYSNSYASRNSGCLSRCNIVVLENTEKISCCEMTPSTETTIDEVKIDQNTSFYVERVLPGSKAGGETYSSPSSRQANGMLQTELDPLLALKSTVEIPAEIEEDIMAVMTREEFGVLIENKYLKTNSNYNFLDTEQPLIAQILEETKLSGPLQDGHFQTIACSADHNDSKNPRRSSRRRNFLNGDSVIMEETLVTAKDMSPFKRVSEENTVKYWLHENDGYIEKRPTIKSPVNIAGSSCLSKSCHKSHVQMPAEDIVEMNMSNQCNIKKKEAKGVKFYS
ncbi:uncharacterized protein LOC143843661 [Paroedura picta]|uniref:uncharacterized protein LOC143843661 n=1 Tax=Paroedura picta TaxID=143630 RepID=UPI0040579EB9